DFENVHKELAKPNVTLTLLHDEYVREAKSVGKIPYAYRTFAEHYHNYAMKYKATMRIRRKPGEILEVDWAGQTLSVIDDYYAPSGPPIRPIESFNIQLESTGTQIESSKIAMPISA